VTKKLGSILVVLFLGLMATLSVALVLCSGECFFKGAGRATGRALDLRADASQDEGVYTATLPVVRKNWYQDPFRFEEGRLSVSTRLMTLTIEGGAITYVQDRASGIVLVDADAYANRPPVTEGFVGFTSRARYTGAHLRWPTMSSSVHYTKTSTNTASLTWTPLYFYGTLTDSQLVMDLTVDQATGEIVVQMIGIEADSTLEPFSIDLPIMDMTAASVVLGSGARYVRTDARATDQSSYVELGLHSPTMAVAQEADAVIAAWSETTQFAPEYIRLIHEPSYDQLILHGDQDTKQTDRQKIVSPPWRLGTYPTWVQAAKRWRTKFEERTGARPLWENRTPWVRQIHAITNGTNRDFGMDESRYVELAQKAPPDKVLYFIWNGDRIVLHGDHTLIDVVTRPTRAEIDLIKRYGWPVILFHPYSLIHSESGASDRLEFLANKGWLPLGYRFDPDYEGTPENWQNYWTGLKAGYFDGFEFYILHPGSTKFRNYLVRNFGNYCAYHQIDGAYLDVLGDDNNSHFAGDQKIIEGQDCVLGEYNAMSQVAQALPHLAVMSEYQSLWVLPFVFYSWEGSETHIRQNVHAHTRINHPLRVALIGSYSWTRESNTESIDDVVAAFMGTLPELLLADDLGVSEERALWSQARARLFCEQELFNDLPDEWDVDAMAYYRSKDGHWFKFKLLGSTYGYVEVLPDGQEIVRLAK
jgi:hypothetical protein